MIFYPYTRARLIAHILLIGICIASACYQFSYDNAASSVAYLLASVCFIVAMISGLLESRKQQ